MAGSETKFKPSDIVIAAYAISGNDEHRPGRTEVVFDGDPVGRPGEPIDPRKPQVLVGILLVGSDQMEPGRIDALGVAELRNLRRQTEVEWPDPGLGMDRVVVAIESVQETRRGDGGLRHRREPEPPRLTTR